MEGDAAMNIDRWNLLKELEEKSERQNRKYARPTSSRKKRKESLAVDDWIPQVDISEADHEYVITAELPGLKKEDVKITLADGVLALQGERKQEREDKGTRYHRVERSYGSFL